MKDILFSILKESGKLLLNYYKSGLETKVKESHASIVTHADIETEQFIISSIRDSYPNHNIISEEQGFIDRNSRYTWIIDPLDGTSNYASSLSWFGTLIALFEDKEVVMAGAYLPVQDKLYYAEKNKGAYCNKTKLKIDQHLEIQDALFCFNTDPISEEKFLNEGIDLFKCVIQKSRNLRATNSLLDYLYITEGIFGGCINLFNKIWDIAAPFLIITEAGGIMKNIRKENIRFSLNEHSIKDNYSVIATANDRIFNAIY